MHQANSKLVFTNKKFFLTYTQLREVGGRFYKSGLTSKHLQKLKFEQSRIFDTIFIKLMRKKLTKTGIKTCAKLRFLPRFTFVSTAPVFSPSYYFRSLIFRAFIPLPFLMLQFISNTLGKPYVRYKPLTTYNKSTYDILIPYKFFFFILPEKLQIASLTPIALHV